MPGMGTLGIAITRPGGAGKPGSLGYAIAGIAKPGMPGIGILGLAKPQLMLTYQSFLCAIAR